MVTDYERAWIELGQLVASKTQWGRAELLQQMAEIAGRCRVPAGELSRLFRLYGVEVERVRSMSTESDPADGLACSGDSVPAATGASRDIIDQSTERGHDVNGNGRARALSG